MRMYNGQPPFSLFIHGLSAQRFKRCIGSGSALVDRCVLLILIFDIIRRLFVLFPMVWIELMFFILSGFVFYIGIQISVTIGRWID